MPRVCLSAFWEYICRACAVELCPRDEREDAERVWVPDGFVEACAEAES